MTESTRHTGGTGERAGAGRPEPGRIALRVNGEPREVPEGQTLEALIRELGLGERRVAAAVNRDVVPRGERASRVLEAGDRVEILEAVGGG